MAKRNAKGLSAAAAAVATMIGLLGDARAQTQGAPVPRVVRNAQQAMPPAKIKAIPEFVLPERYKDRAKHPLPAIRNNSSSPYFGPFDPAVSGLWRQQGNSCANAQTVSCLFNHEANRVRGFRTPAGAKTPEFTYQYTYHFLNDADMMSGDAWMFVEAMEILKETGAPSVEDFGGMEWGNSFHGWMGGYDKYHRAMRYRLDSYQRIDLAAPGGEEKVKQILVDFADGSEHGGNVVFQASSSSRITKTTLQGRPVYENFGTGGGHSLSIVGYDDNFLPERGGSWILHDVHANGLAYSPRDRFRTGGPLYWEGIGLPALFLRVRKDYVPRLTFKVTLTHDQRGNIAVLAGVGGPNSTAPEWWKDYAGAFNYAGGLHPMGGRGRPATLEFGLDLTDFAAQLAAPGQKLYLLVLSKGGTGRIDQVSLMDYTGAQVREIAAAEPGKPIAAGTSASPVLTAVSVVFPGTLPVSLRPSPRIRRWHRGPSDAGLDIRDLRGRSVRASPSRPAGDAPGAARGGLAPGRYVATPEGRSGGASANLPAELMGVAP